MIKRPNDKLSDEERYICQAYVDCGRDIKATSKQVGRSVATLNAILAKKKCVTFLGWREIEKQKKEQLDYNFKLYKIKRVIDDFIPDDRSQPLQCREVAVAISAIAESNKMQGHYSAEKVLSANLNMDADLEEGKRIGKEVMADLMRQYKREY